MNVASIVARTHNVRYYLRCCLDWLYGIVLEAVEVLKDLRRPSYVLLQYLVIELKVLLLSISRFLILFVCLAAIVVILSFIKSLRSRYNFDRDRTHIGETKEPRKSDFPKPKASEKVLARSDTDERTRPSFFSKILNNFKRASGDLRLKVGYSLTNSDIQSVYRQLSWSQTQIDLESVRWLNQTLLSLWPCMKGIIQKFLLDDLLKPKTYGLSGYNKILNSHPKVPVEIRNMPKSPSRLSIYISSRRKLEIMHQEQQRALRKRYEQIQSSILNFLIYSIKLVLVYLRQFFMDYIALLIKRPKAHARDILDKRIDIDLDRLLLQPPTIHDKRSTGGGAKSWAGFELGTGRAGSKATMAKRWRRKSKSAPGDIAPRNQNRVIMKTSGMIRTEKLRRKLVKLPGLLERAKQRLTKKEITLEKILLGDSIPEINGIKYLGENQSILPEKVDTLDLVPSDDSNMRFIIELSYESDNKFCLAVSGLPVLDRVRLKKVSFRFRFMLTVNHTIAELNKNLELFETPDDVLFPALNHVQITVVDVPRFDWKLERPPMSKKCRRRVGQAKRSKWSSLIGSSFLDPLNLINNTYFKYIVHSILYLTLKWFQPFDIKIGPHLYIKTVC